MNLDRNAPQGVPRVGKGQPGVSPVGQHGWGNAAAVGGGGFLSVLATLGASEESGVTAGLDASAALVGLPGGADWLPPATTTEPQLPDGNHLMPDAGWHVDTAALLAHLSQSAQWSPLADAAVSSTVGDASAASAALNPGSDVRADASGQSLPLALSALASPSAAKPTVALPAVQPGVQLGVSGRIEADAVRFPVGSPQAAKQPTDDPETQPLLPWGAPPRSNALNMPAQAEAVQKASSGSVAPNTRSDLVAEAVDDTTATHWESAQRFTQQGDAAVARPTAAPGGFAQTVSDTKARQALVVPDVAAQAIAGPSASVLMGVSEGPIRKTDRATGKPTESFAGSAGEGHWGAYALGSGRPVEASAAAQNGALPTPEMMVAEQVSYWIAGKVQNAELRLDVFGRTPVEVSISMQGSEAQVEFRTDQPEIRQVLEGAMAHLKDLLKDEGLSLAGVFVGASGQRRGDAQHSPGQSGEFGESGARQARVEVPLVNATGLTSAQRPVAGRTVDLFV